METDVPIEPGKKKAGGRGPSVGTTRDRAPGRRISRKKNRGVTTFREPKERALIAMYRHGGKSTYRSLSKVAKELGIPFQQLASLLKAAFKEGMFAITLNLEAERIEIITLEHDVKTRFADKGLRRVTLVHADEAILGELDSDERARLRREVTDAMAAQLASYLDAMVASAAKRARGAGRAGLPAPLFRIGVGPGRTLRALADHLRRTPRPVRTSAVETVASVGYVGLGGNLEANMNARDIAETYGGQFDQIPCVGLPMREEAAVVIQPHQVREGLQKCLTCDVVITGIGPVGAVPDNGNDLPSSKEIEAIRRGGGCLQIGYSVLDAAGRQVPTAYKPIGLSPEDLYRMVHTSGPDGRREVILIAGGDRRRIVPIKVALSAGLVSWLVTDTVTAKSLLDEP